MNYKGHIIFSIIFLAIFLLVNKVFNFFPYDGLRISLYVLITVFYSVLADIDTSESNIGKTFLVLSALLIIFCLTLKYYALASIIFFILIFMLLVKHRGITHTLLGAIAFSLPLLFIAKDLFVVGLLSFLSHLVADWTFKLY